MFTNKMSMFFTLALRPSFGVLVDISDFQSHITNTVTKGITGHEVWCLEVNQYAVVTRIYQ